MVKKIVELYQQELHIYSGNYDFYEKEKAERIEIQKRAFENQQDYIRQQERFIERFKAKATKATQAQSAMKRLEKLTVIEDVELERPNIRINFMVDQQPGKIICTLRNVSKSFGDLQILKNTGIELNRGDKIALIGANGKGKSTLLRIIAGTEPIEGERIWGHNVREAFYAQHQLEALDVQNNILEEMATSRAGKTELEYRSLLGCFLFSGEEVEKKVRVLSGGEKARVALAKTIVSKANFLMLDEPTNLLDMHSVELLIEALNRYEGSILLVSHDRYFISRIANVFWEIINHEIREFRGTYAEYLEWKEKITLAEVNTLQSPAVVVPQPTAVEKQVKEPQNGPKGKPIDKEKQKELQKQQKQFEKVEQTLNDLQTALRQQEAKLAEKETYANPALFKETEMKWEQLKKQVSAMQREYEAVFERLMQLEEEYANSL